MDLLREFMEHFHIPAERPRREVLGSVAAAFARLPYENLSKIIKHAECGNPEKARRYPEEVIGNHIEWGTGGTCFALTATLLHLARSLGYRADYVLADRRYGQNTHCALLVWIDDVPHLLDPGFLLVDPVPLPSGREREIVAGSNILVLAPDAARKEIALSTVRKGAKTYRLTYKTEPADPGEFEKAWDASFSWDMMRYPLLTQTKNSRQIYMKGSMLQIRTISSMDRREIPLDDLTARISSEFHIHPSVVARAISLWRHRGDIHG